MHINIIVNIYYNNFVMSIAKLSVNIIGIFYFHSRYQRVKKTIEIKAQYTPLYNIMENVF